MNIKIIDTADIEIHDSFNKSYLKQLHVCQQFVTKEEQKNNKYCSEHCKNECYKKQKIYFEQYVAEIRNPELVYVERNSKTDLLTYIKPCGMNKRYTSSQKFINIWLHDVNNASFNVMDFYPDKTQCPKEVYNIFNGYAVEKIYVKDQTKEQKEELLKPILKHFCDIFESDETVNYILKHFANTIQHPQRKVGVSVVIQGNQGTGKSFIIDEMLVPLIGDNLYYYTCKPADIGGDHAEGQCNKLVVTVDELNAKRSFDISELLKSFITQKKLTVNPKGIRPYEVKNFCIYYFTTNSKTPLKIELGDRRYFATRMLDTYKNNGAYYKQMSKYMKRPDVLTAWYDYLVNIDVEDYDYIENRPESKIYNDMKDACTSNIVKFMNDTFMKLDDDFDDVQTMRSGKMFAKYNDWKSATNHKDEHNTTSFGREITGIKGIKKDRDSKGNIYKIDIKELMQYFKANKLFGNTKTDEDDICEMDKLRKIITRQQAELSQLRQEMAVLKTVNVNINISDKTCKSEVDYDSDNDNDHIKYITNNFFNIKKDKEKKKEKQKKKTPTSEFVDIANDMLALI